MGNAFLCTTTTSGLVKKPDSGLLAVYGCVLVVQEVTSVAKKWLAPQKRKPTIEQPQSRFMRVGGFLFFRIEDVAFLPYTHLLPVRIGRTNDLGIWMRYTLLSGCGQVSPTKQPPQTISLQPPHVF